MNELFFALIRVALGTETRLPHTPSPEEWKELYRMAKKQSLLGICFAGVQRLQSQQQCPPEEVYDRWMAMSATIQMRNKVVNKACLDLQEMVWQARFNYCILKGQGVAQLYDVNPVYGLEDDLNPRLAIAQNLSMLRQPGDIDIWLSGGYDKIKAWVDKVAPTKKINQHHMDLNVYRDVEVEAHFHPINLPNPWRQKRLKAYIKWYESLCFTHNDYDDEKRIHTPHVGFNVVFLMVHIFHHLFTEGVGLRQVMDYYMVLRTVRAAKEIGGTEKFQTTIKGLGLERFACALMWVIAHVLIGQDGSAPLITGSDSHDFFLGFEPNEKDGRFLLEEIMLSGNFGKEDERQEGLYDSKLNSFWMIQMKTFRFFRFDHWAWLWSPIYRIAGYCWRRANGYRQY